MSTKSQKTEDMLDQTFANFDSEVTGAETQQTQEAGSSKGASGAKKSNNMIVFIGAGVAAVGAVAYLFVIKPMLAPAPQAPRAVAKAPVTPPKPVVPAAEQKPAEVAPAVAPAGLPGAEQKPAEIAPTSANANPLAPATTEQKPAEVVAPGANPAPTANPSNPLDVKAEVPAAVKVEAPANPASATQPVKVDAAVPAATNGAAKVDAPKVAGVNAQSVAVVDDLKSMFDKQTSEFKTVLTDIDTRVGTLESSVNEQKDINTKFDQRITALETNKKPAAVKAVKKAPVDSAEAPATAATPVHAKAAHTHAKKKASVVKHEAKADSSVLVDKSTEVQKAKVEAVKAEKAEKAEKANLPQVALHSIYGGRLWIKNSDGSLSTFSAGDRLPTGETIKSIDDEKFEVHTDKRVLKN